MGRGLVADFSSHTFTELQADDGSTRSFASAAAGRRHAIPGGDRVLVHRNIAAAHAIETNALCSYAELEALRGAVGSQGTLTLNRTAGMALLLGVLPTRVYHSTCYQATLRFRYTGSLTVPGAAGWGTLWGTGGWGE
jgi:hypothetical protein